MFENLKKKKITVPLTEHTFEKLLFCFICLCFVTLSLSHFILDIDECSSVREPCTTGFNCINTVGSYTCQRKIIMCSQGYHSSPDGARCIGENAHKYRCLLYPKPETF